MDDERIARDDEPVADDDPPTDDERPHNVEFGTALGWGPHGDLTYADWQSLP